MSNKEIVTLQFGHYANFVGTHWWNLQESSFVYDPQIVKTFPKEVNHDVLFREGQTVLGHTTFTPRLVLVDLNGSLGSLRKEGSLYGNATEDNIQWLGDVTLHKSDPAKKNKFLRDLEDDQPFSLDEAEHDSGSDHNDIEETESDNPRDELTTDHEDPTPDEKKEADTDQAKGYDLNSDVEVWSDFLRTGLHPRSIQLVNNYLHNDSNNSFNIFGQGEQVAKSDSEWSALEDRIRYFTEECDHLQGFHILCDSHNGFGGLASSALTYLSDEYRSKAKLTFSLTPACPPDQTVVQRTTRLLTQALSLRHHAESSSLLVPLSLASSICKKIGPPVTLDLLDYKPELDYHTSAILASALDTASLPYRKEMGCANMTDITDSFNTLGKKVSALNLALPMNLYPGGSVAQSLISLGKRDPWTSLTPGVTCRATPLFHSCVLRGATQYATKIPSPRDRAPNPLASCSSVDDVLRMYIEETYPGAYNSGCSMRDGLVTSAPFPNIFSPNVNWQGCTSDTLRPPSQGVEHVPAMTSLQATPDMFPHIDTLTQTVAKFNLHKHPHFIDAGLEMEDLDDSIEALEALAGCYE